MSTVLLQSVHLGIESIFAFPLREWPQLKSTYLKTRSEAWLDLEPSQLWCFSWALASFSAAAIGHPDRLKWDSDFSGRVTHESETHFDMWKCYIECTCCMVFGLLEYCQPESLCTSVCQPINPIVYQFESNWPYWLTFSTLITTQLVTACMSLVEWLEIILRIDVPLWTNVHFYMQAAASCVL